MYIYIYVAYAISGGRWEPAKKACTHALLEAVQQDVTALLLGDFNLQVEDCHVLQTWSTHGPWYDCNVTTIACLQQQPTCRQGKGSRIGFIMASKHAYDLISSYAVQQLKSFTPHSAVSVILKVPQIQKVRRTQRQVAQLPCLLPPTTDAVRPESRLPAGFNIVLANRDTTEAFRIWSAKAEAALRPVAAQQGHFVQSNPIRRGEIKFATRVSTKGQKWPG